MKNSPQRGLEVFDFKPEDDEFPDLIAGKYKGGCQNSDSDNTSILKYEFLECGMFPSSKCKFVISILMPLIYR